MTLRTNRWRTCVPSRRGARSAFRAHPESERIFFAYVLANDGLNAVARRSTFRETSIASMLLMQPPIASGPFKSARWRLPMSKYELHPVVFEYPDFTPDERERMKADLKANGQRVPILLWQDQIVDGRHRDELLRELDIEPVFASPLAGASEAEMRAFVASLNVHRRSRTERLTNAEKEARVEAELRKDHTRSNNAIAKATGVSDKTVAKIRKKLWKTTSEFRS